MEIFFIGQNRSSNQKSGVILEVHFQNCGARVRAGTRAENLDLDF